MQVYSAGSWKKFQVSYERIMSIDPYEEGFGIMCEAQTAKPRTSRTGDDWFPCNLTPIQG